MLLRGHKISLSKDGTYIFTDTGESTVLTWQGRGCGHCSLDDTPEGHDGCIGTLSGEIINACCGHGEVNAAYIQYENGTRISGIEALEVMKSQSEKLWQF